MLTLVGFPRYLGFRIGQLAGNSGSSAMTPLTLDTQKPPVAASAPARLTSLDAYRGFVMFLMMAEVLSFARVARARPDSVLWRFLAHHQSHVEWIGCSLHDLIQPSFSFLVGVALPFSLASRAARGQSRTRMTLHATWRALVLILLGDHLYRRLHAHRNAARFRRTVFAMAQVPHDVLHHDDGAIHNHSEVERAKGNQVCGDMAQVETYGREKQGKRNCESNDEGSENITEKQKQDDRHQDHPLAEVVQHCVQRVMKQIAAVEHGNDLHTVGQDVIVEIVHLLVNPVERGAFFGPLAHQHTALDDVGLIDNDAVRTMIGSGHVSQPNSGAPVDDRDVLYANWSPIRCRQHGILDILHTAVKSECADVQLLQALFDEAAAGVHVVDG